MLQKDRDVVEPLCTSDFEEERLFAGLVESNLTFEEIDRVACNVQDRWTVHHEKHDLVITEGGSSTHPGRNLESHNASCFGEVSCVTDADVKYYLSNQVTEVNLVDCLSITDNALQAIAANCGANLTNLNVSGCENVTDEALMAIAANCSNLTKLNVSECRKLTDDGLKAIAINCSNLTNLDVSKCKNLTDDALKVIAACCSNLTHLRVSRCSNLTDDALEAIAENCTKLMKLNVSGCSTLTDDARKAIATYCSNLSILFAFSCNFMSLPQDIGDRVPELQTLNLFANKLTALPRSIVKLTKLKNLTLRKKPLQTPPVEVAALGLQAIARYFAELDTAYQAVSMELMVVLVGEGGAGKTSLRNAIAGRVNPRQGRDDSTLYLDREKVEIDDVILSFCDLGGQPAYTSSQALFTTPSALYLLVVPIDKADENNFEDDVGRFLEVLQALVPGAIVQIVITKTDLVGNDESAVSKCKKWLHDAVNEELNRWREAVAKNQNVSPDVVQMLKVQDEVLAVTVDDAAVIDAARKSIVELTTLFPSVGQTIIRNRGWLFGDF